MAITIILDCKLISKSWPPQGTLSTHHYLILNILASSSTWFLQCRLGLPLFLLPSGYASNIFLLISWPSFFITWPAYLLLVNLIYLLISMSLDKVYSSWLYCPPAPQMPFSHIKPYTFLGNNNNILCYFLGGDVNSLIFYFKFRFLSFIFFKGDLLFLFYYSQLLYLIFLYPIRVLNSLNNNNTIIIIILFINKYSI